VIADQNQRIEARVELLDHGERMTAPTSNELSASGQPPSHYIAAGRMGILDQDLLGADSDRGLIALGEGLIEFASLIFISGIYALYLKTVFENGIEIDVFDQQPLFDILDPNGGAIDVHHLAASSVVLSISRDGARLWIARGPKWDLTGGRGCPDAGREVLASTSNFLSNPDVRRGTPAVRIC
jgi:hypothetical protein